ncbi:MAG: hypothetical protein LHW56_08995 [Candidatus Cloacimonetes bacterium]|nr:hypothetical protein [Candidatus Cloacimonadota bacterium]MDY0173030.1 hypothetical protein [Candidatus Cloacimonadaceae bacterium]
MTQKKQKQPTWTDVKKSLSGLRPEELISTISDLYKFRKENKLFLHTRYRLLGSSLDDYQEKIANAVNPLRAQKISFRAARQVISDYKKATGDPEGVAELMVFYCEECARSIKRVGVWEEYAAGTINMWFDTLKYILTLPPEQHIKFWEKLSTAQRILGDTAWGVSDYIDDYMFSLSPYAEDDEEEILNPALPEDMP